jgi:hypothetical protein
MPNGKLWTQHDRFGNDIYLTHERWRHIIDPDNHPEIEPYLDRVRETIRRGRRRQDPYDPRGSLGSLSLAHRSGRHSAGGKVCDHRLFSIL